MRILNYGKQYLDQKDYNALRSKNFKDFLTTGPLVKKFENNIKKKIGAKYVASCSSGTAALHIAFKAIDIKENDVVIVPIINFISSVNILMEMKAKIYFADVDIITGQMTPNTLSECIKKNNLKKVKAFVTMYLGGSCQNNILFYKIKKKINCFMIEDACHALGGKYKINKKFFSVGSCEHADISTFSLHPVKSITTGEGGLITTNNKRIFEKALLFRSHGIVRKKNNHWEYDVISPGLNYRLSDLNCSLGISQLKKLNLFIQKRNEIAKIYFKLLKDIDAIQLPVLFEGIYSSWHLFVIKINFSKLKKKKSDLFKFFVKKNIRVQQHYIPINEYSFYKNKIKGGFKNSKVYISQAVSLPIHYSCSKKDIINVCKNLKIFLYTK
tara:strand:- start:36918 stop:38069 length:1152 start_codon:yes stop_codon:yes gene_type:complete